MAENWNQRRAAGRQNEYSSNGRFNSNSNKSDYGQYNQQTSNKSRIGRKNYPKKEEKVSIFLEKFQMKKLDAEKIKKIEKDSNTKLTLYDTCLYPDRSVIIVNGTAKDQEKATDMIDLLLCDDPNKLLAERVHKDDIDWTAAAAECEKIQQEKWATYGSFKRDFYIEDSAVANFSEQKIEEIRRKNNDIKVQLAFDIKDASPSDLKIPNPIETFEQAFRVYPDIMVEIEKQGFQQPSPIQCQAWPILLSGKDMIGIAQTGTGKTLAFLLPALIHIDNQDASRKETGGPIVLVMAPTRELALQIEKEVKKYDYHGIRAVCLYGGGDRREQVNLCKQGVEIVIATPGRLNDLIQASVLDLTSVSYLVLDEADRMLDMGFEPQIRKSLLDVRPDRQSVMTSATWPPGVRRLAQSYMKNPITVCVGSLDLKAVHTVTQRIHIVTDEDKTDMLLDFFNNMGPDDKVIVFFGKKSKVDEIGCNLALSGVINQSIHGGREQADREQALADIKSGEVRILLATDVASRGLDIDDLTHVFNYDFPKDIEEYVHRVGRTGRAGRTGESISLLTRKDWALAGDLIKILEEAEQEIPYDLSEMSKRYDNMRKQRSQGRDNDRWGGRRDYGRDRYGGGGGRRW